MDLPLRGLRRLIPASATTIGVSFAAVTAAGPAPASASAGAPAASSPLASPTCGPSSCSFTRTGQSLFKVPRGVTFLQADVIGAGGRGGAVEVRGNLVLPGNENALEVVVGGKNTLGGTTSEILTSTASTPRVLVAARGNTVGQNPASQKAHGRRDREVDEPVAAPTMVPVNGSIGPAKGGARVTLTWRSPSEPPAVTSSRLADLRLGMPAAFVVRTAAPTAPRVTEKGSLPLGVRFHDEGNGTATIEGVPIVGGVYPLEVTVRAGAALPVIQHMVLTVRGAPFRLGSVISPVPGAAHPPE